MKTAVYVSVAFVLLAIAIILVRYFLSRSQNELKAKPSVSDNIECGDISSESAHNILTSGDTNLSENIAKTGTVSESCKARQIKGNGSFFQYEMQITKNSPLTIQLQEFRPNDQWGAFYGYDVYIDDSLVYKRDPSTADCGGGSYHSTFIDTGDMAVIGKSTCIVKIVSSSDNPAFFVNLRTYSNLDEFANANGLAKKMTLVPLLGETSQDEEKLQDKITGDISGIKTNDQVEKGFAVLYNNFLGMGTEQTTQADMRKTLDKIVNLAAQNNLPVQVKFNTEWAGTPKNCPDGMGGTFTDVKYQQILYSDYGTYNDPLLAEYMGSRYNEKYGLSIPNVWGDTPWLTYNNPVLNSFIGNQFKKAMSEVNTKMYELQKDGRNLLLPLTTASEAIYWARVAGKGVEDSKYKTEVNGNIERKDLWGDFNKDTVAAALADGVILDPTDGLDLKEKEWLHQNLATHSQNLVNDIFENIERERIGLKDNKSTYPVEMLKHKIYTEPYASSFYPLFSGSRPICETGVVTSANPGAEYFYPSEFDHLLRLREFGTIANPNFETTALSGIEKVAILRQMFATGSDHVTLYNYASDMNSYCNEFSDNMISYDPAGSNIKSGDLIEIKPENSMSRIGQSFTAGPGNQMINEIGIKIKKVGDTSKVNLSAAIYDSFSKAKLLTMRIMSDNELNIENDWIKIPVPIIGVVNNRSYYLEITEPGMTEGNYYAILASDSNSYSGGKIFIDGSVSTRSDMIFRTGVDLLKERNRSLMISAARDAKDLVDTVTKQTSKSDIYAKPLLDEAVKALSQFKYNLSYQKALAAESNRFPILYQIKGDGENSLSQIPVSINTNGGTVDLDVIAFNSSGNALKLKIKSYSKGNVMLKFNGALATKNIYVDGIKKSNGTLSLDAKADITYTIELKD